ncbi:alanine racemase [Thermohalobacter berrensis]|uniref:Alanine racemase n=1 Tax=Thermohalobacter berrensis TaxID=99594 RepID=A0A419SXS8_9FIRM|nr:alanine racemase [Thermohalobacter berrensis]RKD30070.1 alanine racemase [Thermohalobacter berrensis]
MDTLEKVRPVWAEINLDNLIHNLNEVKRIVKEGTLITAVVKADAYGHGSIMAAKTFLENGADRLAVATLSEAIELRNNGINAPILILGYTPTSQAEEVVSNNIIQTVYTFEHAKKISKAAKKLDKTGKIHIKIDTGMSRIGFKPNESTINDIIKITELDNIEIEGIFSHFAVADEKDKTFTEKQFQKFNWLVESLEDKGIVIPIKHISNSAATIDLPDYNLNMVRPGIMLYGLYPSDEVNKEKVKLKPAMTLKTHISHVKQVSEGTGVSYGLTFTTDKKSTIGTLPIGYADGFTRLLSNKTEVAIKGKRAPIIGRICMDQSMVDLTDIERVKPGDEVIIMGDGKDNSPHIDEIAKILGTINYEVVCMVSRRVPRVYIKNDKIVCIKDYLLE